MSSRPGWYCLQGADPPFLYGTHYSCPGYVMYWLVRAAPAHLLRLQNGRFDAPDRMFLSLGDSWDSVTRNPADVKELIPEFFLGDGRSGSGHCRLKNPIGCLGLQQPCLCRPLQTLSGLQQVDSVFLCYSWGTFTVSPAGSIPLVWSSS